MAWEWLKTRLKDVGSNSAQFAHAIEWDKSRVYELFSGKTKAIPLKYIEKAARHLKIDVKDMIALNNGQIVDISKSIVEYPIENIDSVNIDMLDATACCGEGIDNFQENVIGCWSMPINDYKSITVSSNPNKVKMLRVKGDSMFPTIKDGDWVLVDISYLSPDSDGMFLLYLSTGLAIKRLQGTVTDEIVIKSDNPKYDNFNAKLADIRIVGKVIYTLNAEKVG